MFPRSPDSLAWRKRINQSISKLVTIPALVLGVGDELAIGLHGEGWNDVDVLGFPKLNFLYKINFDLELCESRCISKVLFY